MQTIKSGPTAAIAATVHLFAILPEARAQDWNYFGVCYSDDVILARNGKFFAPCFGRDCKKGWGHGGTYRVLTDSVIEIF